MRFTDEDETRVFGAITSAVAGYGRDYRVTAADWETLRRIAAHAIGCSTFDLRDSELAFIDDAIQSHPQAV